jgi:hypothetical protein
MTSRRTHPSAAHPRIMAAIPSVIPRPPRIRTVRRIGPDLNDARRWRNVNVHTFPSLRSGPKWQQREDDHTRNPTHSVNHDCLQQRMIRSAVE